MENEAVSNLREYIRIPSVHPNIDYMILKEKIYAKEPTTPEAHLIHTCLAIPADMIQLATSSVGQQLRLCRLSRGAECVSFIKRLAKKYDLLCKVVGCTDKPVVILTWQGTDKNAGSILLNSHMDVVPVYKEKWTHDPFEAVKDSQGNIYGRGSQDTKSTGIQHISAVRRLMDKQISVKRTVHILFVPDEEVGGETGMGRFVKSKDFQNLNIVCAIDEGSPTSDGEYAVFIDERCALKIKVHCTGPTGHGSLLLENTAGEKLQKVLAAFMDLRQTQVLKMKNSESVELAKLAEVTTINLTEVEGGIQNNVVPPELILGFDVRLSVLEDHEKFFAWIENVCKTAGNGVFVEYTQKEPKTKKTAADSTNPFWIAFKDVMDKMNIPVNAIPFYGTTDARYLRRLGVPSFGFSPMRYTPMLLHDHNEFLNESIFMEGIDVYANLIEALANV